jgi:hypothetical protein
MLVQMVLFPPMTCELQILWHVPMKKKSIIMKNDTLNSKSDTYNSEKLKTYTCDLEKAYHENCYH